MVTAKQVLPEPLLSGLDHRPDFVPDDLRTDVDGQMCLLQLPALLPETELFDLGVFEAEQFRNLLGADRRLLERPLPEDLLHLDEHPHQRRRLQLVVEVDISTSTEHLVTSLRQFHKLFLLH